MHGIYQQNTIMTNPFLTYGYAGADYFCDRVEETKRLTALLTNGNHVALMSPRRMGKTGLLNHCFAQKEIKDNYYTFIIDIYSTKSLAEFTYALGKGILKVLKSKERQAWERFIHIVGSFRTGITFDELGKPSWNIEIGDIKSPMITLDEIFDYLAHADKPCLVAIDEFQSIVNYEEKNVEAVIRTYIQQCNNAWFVFSGSKRSMMGEIFSSPARPFYQSATTMMLPAVPLQAYTDFIVGHFRNSGKDIDPLLINSVYERFEGTTWYIQKIVNELYASTVEGTTCEASALEPAIMNVVSGNEDVYKETLYRLTTKQKAVLMAIAKEDSCTQVTSSAFIKANSLPSASSVQKALAALVDKEIVTNSLGKYSVYDYFFRIWLRQANW